jgi:hypothetical protein
MSRDSEYGFYILPVLPSGASSMELGAMGHDAAVSALPWFGVDGGKLPYPVYMRLGRDTDGRVAVVGLHVDGTEQWQEYGPRPAAPDSITARSLRDAGAAIIEVLRQVAEHRPEDPMMARFIGPLLGRSATPYAGVSVRPGRWGHPREFYRQVAEAYARLFSNGVQRPYTALGAELFRSESQARRLVSRAWNLFPELKPKEGGKP